MNVIIHDLNDEQWNKADFTEIQVAEVEKYDILVFAISTLYRQYSCPFIIVAHRA